ncbi:MAG: CDP-alcohol phosphatidyltransferase family protein [Spirochaetia bacterium]|jgi:phosphatidylserine synthase|nr:CDP-alcohol phosphatidyltransferase family protein [Spirochaetia bacterium]
MLDKNLRPLKERILLPLAHVVSKYFSPDQISIIAFSFGLVSCLLIILNHLYLALTFWLLNRIIDGLDGTVARISGRQTDWGGYLDMMLDFIIYALIPIALAFCVNNGAVIYITLSIMLGVFYINSASWMYLSAILGKKALQTEKKELTSVNMPTGLIEGTETIVLYSLFFFFPNYLHLLFIGVSGLTIIGIIQRMTWAFKNFK